MYVCMYVCACRRLQLQFVDRKEARGSSCESGSVSSDDEKDNKDKEANKDNKDNEGKQLSLPK